MSYYRLTVEDSKFSVNVSPVKPKINLSKFHVTRSSTVKLLHYVVYHTCIPWALSPPTTP